MNIQLLYTIYEYLDLPTKEIFIKALNYPLLYEQYIDDMKTQIKIEQSKIIIYFITDAFIRRSVFGQRTDFKQLINTYHDIFIPYTTNKNNSTLLQLACFHKQHAFVDLLINIYGLQLRPDNVDHKFKTALIIACSNADRKMAVQLLQSFGNNCNLNIKDETGKTALDYALLHNLDDVIELINK